MEFWNGNFLGDIFWVTIEGSVGCDNPERFQIQTTLSFSPLKNSYISVFNCIFRILTLFPYAKDIQANALHNLDSFLFKKYQENKFITQYYMKQFSNKKY